MKERLRTLLCSLGTSIQARVLASRSRTDLGDVVGETAADVTFRIDRITEQTVLEWFEEHWPRAVPVELVMEGLDEPHRVGSGRPAWTCIVDPVDGTRCLTIDKRSAWSLAALAPYGATLADVEICAMTELPTSRQWRADQVSAVRGQSVVAGSLDVRAGNSVPLDLRPSAATDFRHGFASLAKFFPEGKARTAALEERLWTELYGTTRVPLVFDDQYPCTGGQVYEILAGRDLMAGDIRPYVMQHSLTCHPYDICTAMLIEELGGVFEHPEGGSVSVPLDTTSSVAWVGYANPVLAATVRPILARLIAELT